jgi:ABC-type phosphate transport system substrate-binding protein
MKATKILAAGLVAAAIAGCSGGGGGTASSVVLTGAGATFPYPIYSKWFEMYHESTGLQINYQSIGSGGGIQQLKAGTVDFGASDAALNDEKLKEMPHPVLHIPTVAGAVVLAYNLPELTQPLQLTPQALAGIFMGTVKTWNDPAIKAANPRRGAPRHGCARGAPFRRERDVEHLHDISLSGQSRVEEQGGREHVGRVAGRSGCEGQRRGLGTGEADAGLDRLR